MSSRMPSAQRSAQQHNDFSYSNQYYPTTVKKSSSNSTIYLSHNANGRANIANHHKAEDFRNKSCKSEGHQNGELASESKDVGENQWKNIRVMRNSSSFTHSSNNLQTPASNLRTSSNSSSPYSSHDDERVFNIHRDLEANCENHEEFTYGKGFVNKIRQLFQATDAEKSAVPILHFSTKRAQSCENISKKTKLKEIVHVSEEKNDNKHNKHIAHSVENLVVGSQAENNKNLTNIPLHNSVSDISTKQPSEEEDSNLIPQNVVASTKVLFEKNCQQCNAKS